MVHSFSGAAEGLLDLASEERDKRQNGKLAGYYNRGRVLITTPITVNSLLYSLANVKMHFELLKTAILPHPNNTQL